MSSIQKRVQEWLEGPYDEASKEQIRSLQKTNPKILTEAFFSRLSFGTGGIRALMGIGSCRLNIYTIQMISQGLSRYVLSQNSPLPSPSIVIGFDSRHNSLLFAQEAARVFAGNGIRAQLLDALRPVAYTSFVTRHQSACAGVMITASHNPKEYNGYKVFWSDGAQVVFPHDAGITEQIDAISHLEEVKIQPLSHPLISILDTKLLDEAFLEATFSLQHFAKQNASHGSSLKITYTSLHGTGITMVPKALAKWGFTNIHYVTSQSIPDGDFPTVPSPNPENKETLRLGMEKLEEIQGDLLFATDPDADRMGVVVRHKGKLIPLTGNEIAAIATEFLAQQKPLPPKGAFITTIVTTPLMKKIAEKHHLPCFEVLTGFKFIGEQIHKWELAPNEGYTFLFGAEESYGFLLGTYARDKDAIIGTCLLSEIALHAKEKGKTLIDLLENIYQTYGIYQDAQISCDFLPGSQGMEKMQQIMQHLRNYPPQVFGDHIATSKDYLKKEDRGNLPASDVLSFTLKEGARFIIRPSGTEPKIKIYGSLYQPLSSSLDEGLKRCKEALTAQLTALKKELLG